MNIKIIYFSKYGNTEKIAQALSSGTKSNDKVELINIEKAEKFNIFDTDVLIVGSPTYGGRPCPEIKKFLDSLSFHKSHKIIALTFDTGMTKENQKFFLKGIISLFGYASPKIAREMEKKGFDVRGNETFFVKGEKGPLKEGEIERAKNWVKAILY